MVYVPKLPSYVYQQGLKRIPTSILREGRSEYLVGRGETLAGLNAEQEYGEETPPEALDMQGLADEMKKPQSLYTRPDQGPNKFLSMLGTVMKPLTYLDIPIELAAEAIEGVVPGKWWGEGTDEREDFEGWKALFEGLKGQKGIIDVADEIAHAFEKRPFLAQVGLGFAYGMPISKVGTIARLGRAAKPTMYALDPAQLVFDYAIKPVVKKGWKHRPMALRGKKDIIKAMEAKYGKGIAGGAAETQEDWDKIVLEHQARFNEQTSTEIYRVNPNKYAKSTARDFQFPQDRWNPFVVTELSRNNKMENAINRLRSGLAGKEFIEGTGDAVGTNGRPEVSQLLLSRDLALIDLEQAVFGREGQLHNVSVRELEQFLEDGYVPLRTKTKTGAMREGFMFAPQVGPSSQAQASVANYLTVLKNTQTKAGTSLYQELLQQNAPAFKAVDITLDTNHIPTGIERAEVGAFKGGEDANILTPRLRFYNVHYGSSIGEGDITQPLPESSQFLRAIAATRWAHASPQQTSDEIGSMLMHSNASPDEWATYVYDPDAIDTRQDIELLFGSYFRHADGSASPVAKEGDNYVEGFVDDYFSRDFGIQQRNAVVIRKGNIVSKKKPVEFSTEVKAEIQKYGMSVEKADEVINNLALTRNAMINAERTKKGLRQAGDVFTKAHREYAQWHTDFKYNRIYHTAKHEDFNTLRIRKGSIADSVVDEIQGFRDKWGDPELLVSAEAKEQYDAMLKVGTVMRMQEEAIQADISFTRLKNRQQLIVANLKKAGWIYDKGHGKYELLPEVNQDALIVNKAKYGEDIEISRDEAWRLWGPYANASSSDDWVEMGDGWVGYERKFGPQAATNFQNSYGGIQQQTRKLGNQLHAHEIMVTGTVFKKGEVLSEWMKLYEKAARASEVGGSFNPEGFPLFQGYIIRALWDGVVDPSLATDRLLSLPGVEAKIIVNSATVDYTWDRAISHLSAGIKSGGMNPHQAMAIGAKQVREQYQETIAAFVSADETLQGLENFDFADADSLADAQTRVRDWLGIGLIEAVDNPDLIEQSMFLRQNRAAVESAQAKRNLLQNVGKITDGSNPAHVKDAIKQLILEDDSGMAGLFGSDLYKTLADPKTGERILDIDKIEKRAEALARLLTDSPDGVNTILGEAGFHAAVNPNPRLPRGNKQKVLAMRRPYTPTGGVEILDKTILYEDSLTGYMLKVEDMASSQIQKIVPGRIKNAWLGLDAKGNPLERQNTFHKMTRSITSFMTGGSAASGLRQSTRFLVARNKGYDIAEYLEKESKAQLHLMLSHERSGAVLGAKRQGASTIHIKGSADKPTLAQGRHAVGNRFYDSLQANEMEWNRAGTDITGKWADGTEMSDRTRDWIRTAIKAVSRRRGGNFMEGMESKTIKENTNQLLKLEMGVLALDDDMLRELFTPSARQYKQIRLLTNTTANMDEKAAMSGYFMREEILKAAENTPAGRKAAEYLDGPYVPRLRVEMTANIAMERTNWNGLRTNDEWWLKGRQDENPFFNLERGEVYTDVEESLGLYIGSMNRAIVDQQTNYALKNLDQYTYRGRGFKNEWVDLDENGDAIWKGAEDLDPDLLKRIKADGFLPDGMRTMNAREYHKAAYQDRSILNELDIVIDNVLGETDLSKPFAPLGWKGTLNDNVDFAADVHKALNADYSHMGRVQLHINNLAKAKSNIKRAEYLMATNEHGVQNVEALRQAMDDVKYTAQDAIERCSLSAGEKWQKLYQNSSTRWLKNLKMDKADLDEIDAHLSILQDGIAGYGMQALAQGARPMSRFLRTFKAGFDAGVLLIHGYNALVKLPFEQVDGQWRFDFSSQKAWGVSAKKLIQFMRDPEYYEQYMATPENIALRNKMAPYSKLGHSEPLSLMTESSTFQRFRRDAELLPVVGKARVAHRAEAAFVGTLDVLRMEMWKAMEETVKSDWERTVGGPLGKAWSDNIAGQSREQIEYLTEFGAVVNKMTGVYDQTLSALRPTQGTIEQSLIFFAPMYRRATYGIIADIARGGMRKRMALKQLGGVITAGVTMGVLAEHAFGNEGASTPDSGNFGKFVIAGQKMGIGTAWYTAFRLASDIALGATADPEGEVGDFLKDHPIITALGRRGRSQLAPPASILIDMMQGKNYIGEPLMDRDGSRDWTAHLRYTGKQFMPFWADSVLTGGKSGMVGGFAEAIGLQSMPVSDYDIVVGTRQYLLEEETGLGGLNDWRAQQKSKGKKLVWSELPDKVRLDLETGNKQLIEAMADYKEKWSDIARGDDRDWVIYADRKEAIDLESKKRVATLTTQFEKGLIGGRKLNQEVKSIKQYRRLAHSQLIGDPTIPSVSERFAELREAGAHELDTAYYGDLLFDDYIATVVSAENTEDSDGMFLVDNYASNIADFQARHNLTGDSPMWNYIESRKSAWYQENPVLMELDASKKMLDPYWNIHKTLFTGEDLHKATRYLGALSEHQKAEMVADDPSLKPIVDKISRARIQMRIAKPEYDWELTKWHGARPKTEYGRIMEDTWESRTLYARNTGLVKTPDPEGYQRTGYGRVTHSTLTGVQ